MKIAIFATHPIQYQVPWFQRLAAQPGVDLKVYYALIPDAQQQGIGFGHLSQHAMSVCLVGQSPGLHSQMSRLKTEVDRSFAQHL